ncbi:MAG TPA: hypothetical protein VN841_26070 [Bryobacteraceae bacterium]|nr:hypothetical protein [Bryobacteraceae bacterium]
MILDSLPNELPWIPRSSVEAALDRRRSIFGSEAIEKIVARFAAPQRFSYSEHQQNWIRGRIPSAFSLALDF